LASRRRVHSFPPRRSSDLRSSPYQGEVGWGYGSQPLPRMAGLDPAGGLAPGAHDDGAGFDIGPTQPNALEQRAVGNAGGGEQYVDRKSTRLNSSHVKISYA